jgi:hypothetical protein
MDDIEAKGNHIFHFLYICAVPCLQGFFEAVCVFCPLDLILSIILPSSTPMVCAFSSTHENFKVFGFIIYIIESIVFSIRTCALPSFTNFHLTNSRNSSNKPAPSSHDHLSTWHYVNHVHLHFCHLHHIVVRTSYPPSFFSTPHVRRSGLKAYKLILSPWWIMVRNKKLQARFLLTLPVYMCSELLPMATCSLCAA